jgi:hypothetical protein
MFINIRDMGELDPGEVWVLRPEHPEEELTQGHMEYVEDYHYQEDNFIVNLKVNGNPFMIHVHFLIMSVDRWHDEPPFRVASYVHQPTLIILYDSPPSSLVMSASEEAVYRVLKPVYTAICSAAV